MVVGAIVMCNKALWRTLVAFSWNLVCGSVFVHQIHIKYTPHETLHAVVDLGSRIVKKLLRTLQS